MHQHGQGSGSIERPSPRTRTTTRDAKGEGRSTEIKAEAKEIPVRVQRKSPRTGTIGLDRRVPRLRQRLLAIPQGGHSRGLG